MRIASIVVLVLALLLAGCDTPESKQATETAGAASAPMLQSADPTATGDAAEPMSTTAPEEPTATLEPTATSEPTATATPEPPPTATPEPTSPPEPTPLPQPIVYSGTGPDVINIEKPGDVVIARITGNASGRYFGVTTFDEAGQQVDLLVNTTDPYAGTVLLDAMDHQDSTRIQVEAEGEWTIELLPLQAARRAAAPGVIEGQGDDVFIIDGTPDVAQIRGNAEGRYFGVWAYGTYPQLLVNTTDPYDGKVIVDRKSRVVQVTAEGAWTIDFQ